MNEHSEKKQKKFSKNIIVLAFVSFFNDISSESIARILPVFLKEVSKASFVAIGWIEGLADSLSILLRLISGWIVDTARKKKPFLIFGYALSACTRPFYPLFIVWFGWMGALILKGTDRIGKAIRIVPRDALIAIESKKENRGKGFGLNRALDTLGALIGVGMIAFLIHYFGDNSLDNISISPELFKISVYVASFFGIIAVFLIIIGLKEKKIEQELEKEERLVNKTKGSYKDLPKNLYYYIGCVSLFSLAGSSDAFLILKLREIGFSLVVTLLLIVGYNFIAAASAYPLSRLSDTFKNRKYFILSGWIIYAATYFLFAYSSSLWVLAIGFILYGLYYGFVESTEKALVADLAPKTHLGRAYGIFNFATGLMLLPANLIFGYLADQHGSQTAFLVGGCITLAAVLGLVFFRANNTRSFIKSIV